MTDVLILDGLLALVRGVRARFEDDGVSAVVDVGWTKRYRQDNQGPGGANRVVFIPGESDPSSGAPKVLEAGEINLDGEQMHLDDDVRFRTLAWWHAPYTVSVWGVDPAHPKDEAGQIWATKRLLRQTIRAMHTAVDPETGQFAGAAQIVQWGRVRWTLPPSESAFGRELTFGFVLVEPQFDAPEELAYPSPALVRDPAG